LTEDFAWEPYSEEFAEREVAARTATRSVLSTQVTYPRPKPATQLVVEEEEEETEEILVASFQILQEVPGIQQKKRVVLL
jgi:hypothetical protein